MKRSLLIKLSVLQVIGLCVSAIVLVMLLIKEPGKIDSASKIETWYAELGESISNQEMAELNRRLGSLHSSTANTLSLGVTAFVWLAALFFSVFFVSTIIVVASVVRSNPPNQAVEVDRADATRRTSPHG